MKDLALQLEWAALPAGCSHLHEIRRAGQEFLAEEIEVIGDPSWERRYEKYGYVLRREMWKIKGDSSDKGTDITAAYNLNGDYIGDSKTAHFLCVKKGIKPEKMDDGHSVCSVGFCEKDQKWYGWSHRAVYGFGVGDMQKKGSCGEQYLKAGFKAKTLGDARKMAVAFARGVS